MRYKQEANKIIDTKGNKELSEEEAEERINEDLKILKRALKNET